MKKKVESIEDKPIEKLFNEHLKKKLVQQIEAKEITQSQLKLRYGIGKTVLTRWINLYGEKVILEQRGKRNSVKMKTRDLEESSQFWRDFRHAKMEASIYKKIVELAKSEYGIDLKKNFGL